MIGLERPELALLLLPAGWLWWRHRDPERGTQALRAALLVCLVAVLCAPYLLRGSQGRDVVVVVDRSRSMTAEAREATVELIGLAEAQRGAGDRLGLVTFGARAQIERPPHEEARFDGFTREVDADGSNLAEALDAALELIPEGRAGSILLLSDGEARGREPLSAARRAFGRGVRIDVRSFARPARGDLAVLRLALPESATSGEPFQFSAWIQSDAPRSARYRLTRDGVVLSEGRRELVAGRSRLLFRDVPEAPGVATYKLELLGARDRVPENDHALGALRVEGPPALLVVNHDGEEDTLVRALRRSGLRVAVASPEGAPLDRLGLEAFRAVVLEDVEAGRLARGLPALARFVSERAGGLLVTGGRASFGVGGYYLSPIDALMPVSMELRKEQRKQGMALAVVMDRSGSMGAQAGGGTKMDLANLGAAAAIELLTDLDAVAVLAVDTEAEVVQRMTRVEDAEGLARRVEGIRAGGGGIYVLDALQAAAAQLEEAPQLSKHITLFADAADAEQQEGCAELVSELVRAGVSLSVIALGEPSDPDAEFLSALAGLGGGELYFTTEAQDLPRLFAQDTLAATRAAFVDAPADVAPRADLYALGEVNTEALPRVDGYNLTYLRPGSLLGAQTTDELHAPILAFRFAGLGRCAAYTGQIGGTYGQPLVAWEGFAETFVTLARWLMGEAAPAQFFPSVFREGREVVVQVELDPEAEEAPDASTLEALLGLADGRTLRRELERESERLYEARFPLERSGVALPSLRIDAEHSLALAPVALPYSPEFEPTGDPERGARLLRRLAQESGGALAPTMSALFDGERSSEAWRPLTRELLILALVLFLLEVMFRRLSLWRAPIRGRTTHPALDAEVTAARTAHGTPLPDAPPVPGANDSQRDAPSRDAAALATALAEARARARRELDR